MTTIEERIHTEFRAWGKEDFVPSEGLLGSLETLCTRIAREHAAERLRYAAETCTSHYAGWQCKADILTLAERELIDTKDAGK